MGWVDGEGVMDGDAHDIVGDYDISTSRNLHAPPLSNAVPPPSPDE